jgi:hypothetical protein
MKTSKDLRTFDETSYEPPKITTYSEEEILELIGPANTIGSPGFHEPHGHGWGLHRHRH